MSNREAVVEKLESKLEGWRTELHRLEENATTIDELSRDRYLATVREVKDQIQQLEKKIRVLENSTIDAWQDLKTVAERAWSEFEAEAKKNLKEVTGINY
jgi:predicted nuclease with TOPRIM domain